MRKLAAITLGILLAPALAISGHAGDGPAPLTIELWPKSPPGESGTIAEEKATNPFLRAGEPPLARSVDREGQDAGSVFEALREWKNKF